MADNPSGVAPFSEEGNFLDHYFANIYLKLEANALLFNRKLPHTITKADYKLERFSPRQISWEDAFGQLTGRQLPEN